MRAISPPIATWEMEAVSVISLVVFTEIERDFTRVSWVGHGARRRPTPTGGQQLRVDRRAIRKPQPDKQPVINKKICCTDLVSKQIAGRDSIGKVLEQGRAEPRPVEAVVVYGAHVRINAIPVPGADDQVVAGSRGRDSEPHVGLRVRRRQVTHKGGVGWGDGGRRRHAVHVSAAFGCKGAVLVSLTRHKGSRSERQGKSEVARHARCSRPNFVAVGKDSGGLVDPKDKDGSRLKGEKRKGLRRRVLGASVGKNANAPKAHNPGQTR